MHELVATLNELVAADRTWAEVAVDIANSSSNMDAKVIERHMLARTGSYIANTFVYKSLENIWMKISEFDDNIKSFFNCKEEINLADLLLHFQNLECDIANSAVKTDMMQVFAQASPVVSSIVEWNDLSTSRSPMQSILRLQERSLAHLSHLRSSALGITDTSSSTTIGSLHP